MQSVLDALRTRDQARARRPLLLLGVLGPILLLAVMWFFGQGFYTSALEKTDHAVTEKVRQSNGFAAKFVASSVAAEIDRYFRAIEQSAEDRELQDRLVDVVEQRDADLAVLARPDIGDEEKQRGKQAFLDDPVRVRLQTQVEQLYRQVIAPLEERSPPLAVSLYACGPLGTHLAGAFPNGSTATIGDNFAYRSYCHGGATDLKESARPMPARHVETTSISSPLYSKLNHRWKIAVSTPIHWPDEPERLLAVLVLSVDVGVIVGSHLEVDDTGIVDPKEADTAVVDRFAMLVDGRDNGYEGMVLDNPMLRGRYRPTEGLAEAYNQFRVSLTEPTEDQPVFKDPFGKVKGGEAYAGDWIAARARVKMQRRSADGQGSTRDTGLLVFVQEDKESATTQVRELGRQLAGKGVRAVIGFVMVVGLLWYFVLHVQGGTRWWKQPPFAPGSSIATPTPAHSASTAAEKTPRRQSS